MFYELQENFNELQGSSMNSREVLWTPGKLQDLQGKFKNSKENLRNPGKFYEPQENLNELRGHSLNSRKNSRATKKFYER